MAHEHGPHICYCPSCSTEVEVGPYIKCNTQVCPQCGSMMRAKETGEYRQARIPTQIAVEGVAPILSTVNIPCPVCGYPIPEPSYVGEEVKCAYCGGISRSIQDITVPNSVVVGLVCFAAGAILGPAFWQALKGGATALERLSRERIK